MESVLARELKLAFPPMAIIFTDDKPDGAVMFVEDRWACVVSMLKVVARGKTAAFDRKRYGCSGGGTGLCLGDFYKDRRGEIEYFLSTGNDETEGEAYFKTPEIARRFLEELPPEDIPFEYVVFKQLAQVDLAKETPELVVMLANPDQLSALVVLANYDSPVRDNVVAPFGAGCHSICLLPYRESKRANPRAVIGMFDISARPHVDADVLSFTVPFRSFKAMEANVPGSFLERSAWGRVKARL